MKGVYRYRNSQLRLLRLCRYAYAAEYVWKIPGSRSDVLQGGSNVHDAIRLGVQEVVKGGAYLDVHQLAYKAVQGSNVLYADAVDVLSRFTESLIEGEVVIDREAVIAVEETLEIPLTLPDGTSVVFFGTIDLAERVTRKRARITDWKTHRHPESQEEFLADAQLKRYALLLSAEYPAFEEFELVKRFVRYSNNVRTTTLTKADLEAVRWELMSEIQAEREIVARGDFQPTGGAWCGTCAHTHTCPLVKQYREAGLDLLTIESDPHAAELAGAAIALDAAAAALKKRLKTYLGDEHPRGVVPVAGGEYGYGPTTSREIGPKKLRSILEEHGIEVPEAVLKVDMAELDRLKKRLPETVVAEIDKATVTTESSQCRFRRTSTKKAAPNPTTPAFAGETEDLFQ